MRAQVSDSRPEDFPFVNEVARRPMVDRWEDGVMLVHTDAKGNKKYLFTEGARTPDSLKERNGSRPSEKQDGPAT